MSKNKPFIIGSIVIVLVLIVVFVQHGNKKSYYSSMQTVNQSNSTVTPTSITTPNTINKNISNKVNEYTLTEVSTHNTRANCWTTINGGVYNITSWIYQHPDGADNIIMLCGIDGSQAFNGQHGGQARPASELASFKIGTLK